MPWMWSDDLARLLIERGEASARQLQDWLDRPTALASESDPVEVARSLLATDARSSDSTSG
jgi:hypothetical protein